MPYATIAQRALGAIEPLAAQAFFVKEVAAEFEAIGLNMAEGYHTARAAPMGVVGLATVHAAFYSFNPRIIGRCLRFDVVSPEQAIVARQRGAGAAIRRLTGDTDVTGLLEDLRIAVEACPTPGRPLFAAHQALDWPEDPAEALWHGANCLREFRGDGHNALLLAHGLIGIEAQVLHAGLLAIEAPTESFLVRGHGWKPDDFAAAAGRLAERGLTEPDGTVTDAGLKLRAMLERETDHRTEDPWRALGEERSERLIDGLAELSRQILEEPALPRLNATP